MWGLPEAPEELQSATIAEQHWKVWSQRVKAP